MSIKTFILTIISSCFSYCFAQKTIEVTQQTISINPNGETEIYYKFAGGDQIMFDFKSKKKMIGVEVLEYPDISRFSDFNVKKIKTKIISVPQKGVYIFRFKNKSRGNICNIRIRRISSNELLNQFNTAVIWESKQITTYHSYTKDVITGYDTSYIQKTKRELVSSTLTEDMIMDRTERVHSETNLDHLNRKTVRVMLPKNDYSEYKTKEMVAWSYWIGVGKESDEAWAKNVKVASGVAKGLSYLAGVGPLGKIAIGTITNLALPTSGEDVYFSFIPDLKNAQAFLNQQNYDRFDKGSGIAAYGKSSNYQDEFYIGLFNDNYFIGIDVNIKIVMVWETKIYEDRKYTETKIVPRYQKQVISDPIINSQRIPILD